MIIIIKWSIAVRLRLLWIWNLNTFQFLILLSAQMKTEQTKHIQIVQFYAEHKKERARKRTCVRHSDGWCKTGETHTKMPTNAKYAIKINKINPNRLVQLFGLSQHLSLLTCHSVNRWSQTSRLCATHFVITNLFFLFVRREFNRSNQTKTTKYATKITPHRDRYMHTHSQIRVTVTSKSFKLAQNNVNVVWFFLMCSTFFLCFFSKCH